MRTRFAVADEISAFNPLEAEKGVTEGRKSQGKRWAKAVKLSSGKLSEILPYSRTIEMLLDKHLNSIRAKEQKRNVCQWMQCSCNTHFWKPTIKYKMRCTMSRIWLGNLQVIMLMNTWNSTGHCSCLNKAEKLNIIKHLLCERHSPRYPLQYFLNILTRLKTW